MKAGPITGRSAGALVAVGALFGLGAPATEAAFPGKNGRIAFTREVRVEADSDPEPVSKVIQTASATGRHRRTLRTCADRSCMFNSDPAWSPGGRFFAFTTVRAATLNEPARGRIGVIHSDGTAPRLLPRLTAYDVEPAWSPRGDAFAFSGSSLGDNTIHTVRADGSHRRRATSGGAQPSWSRTGRIAFTRPAPSTGHAGAIYVMNPNGSALRRLADGRDPDWSPRGRYIAFTGPGRYIDIVRSDGSGSRRLTRGEGPAWSPDGKRIVFAHDYDLWTVRTDGSGLRRIANGHGKRKDDEGRDRELLYVEPSWQPVR